MSRIGRLPVAIPSGVDITIDGQAVRVKGPKGELSHVVAEPITVEKGESSVEVKRPNDERQARALHGLTRSLINNMVLGVTEGYEKKMEIHGTGYRVVNKGGTLEFALGYSHSITVEAPAGISFTVTDWPLMVMSTPLGMATGSRPIRDMSKPLTRRRRGLPRPHPWKPPAGP